MEAKEKLRIALVQMRNPKPEVEANLAHALELLLRASSEKPDLLAFPEVFACPDFCGARTSWHLEWAEGERGRTIETISARAADLHLAVVAPIYERSGGARYDTAVVIRSDGAIAGSYRKVHVMDSREPRRYESFYFAPGEGGFRVFDLDGIRVGVLLGDDRSFPEAWRALALQGARLVVVPCSAGGWRVEHWEIEFRVRAMENGIWVAAVNKVGPQVKGSCFGRSLVVDPWGTVQVQASDAEETILTAEIDLGEVERARARLPLITSRRPGVYKRFFEAPGR